MKGEPEVMISEKEVNKYLQAMKDLKDQYTFFDVHVHPFEIVFNLFDYHPNSAQQGVYSINNTFFRSPKVTTLNLASTPGSKIMLPSNCRPEILLINLRRVYCHTGPKVFSDHMELSGIDRALLLPVAPSTGEIDKHIETMAEMFGVDQRFSLGCSVPNTVEDGAVHEFIREKISLFKIKAIKLHPNITGINLNSVKGKERVERILEACRDFRLPLIVHGGRSPILKDPGAAEYGWIGNLKEINWGISPEAVVIAHGGGYGCDPTEMEQDVLPTLKKLLSRYSNLMVDISGLEMESLAVILNNIDLGRILFGSDTLYQTQWTVLVKLAHTIIREKMNLEETLVQIASRNPLENVFK